MAVTKSPSPGNSDAASVLAKGLRFLRFDEPLERDVCREDRDRMRAWNRVAIWLSACTVLGYAILDHFALSSEHARMTNIVRFGMHVPAVIIMLICTSKRVYARWY